MTNVVLQICCWILKIGKHLEMLWTENIIGLFLTHSVHNENIHVYYEQHGGQTCAVTDWQCNTMSISDKIKC